MEAGDIKFEVEKVEMTEKDEDKDEEEESMEAGDINFEEEKIEMTEKDEDKDEEEELKKKAFKEKFREAFNEKFMAKAMKNRRLTTREELNKIREYLIAKKQHTKYRISDPLRKRIARMQCIILKVDGEMHVFTPKEDGKTPTVKPKYETLEVNGKTYILMPKEVSETHSVGLEDISESDVSLFKR